MEINDELRAFLRARRARLKPEDMALSPRNGAALAALGRRRVPGLRREEVAQLAGVSLDYYARLEQGRAGNVSEEVLKAVADTLRLTPIERSYLFTLVARQARPARRFPPAPAAPSVHPAIHRMLKEFASPAVLLSRALQVLAMNGVARAFLFDVEARPVQDRNIVKWMFLDPEARDRCVDWEADASDYVAALRAAAGSSPGDRVIADLIDELSARSPEFAGMWADHGVSACLNGSMRIKHPEVGEIAVAYQALHVPGDEELTLVLYTAADGSPSAKALRLLGAGPRSHPARNCEGLGTVRG